MRTNSFFLAATAAAGVLLGPALQTVSAETLYGTADRPLAGQRYETLRALAQHLDETARGALEGADDNARRETESAASFLWSISSFARGAEDFYGRVDNYRAVPFEVPASVDDLTTEAQQVNERIRSARALESTYPDWKAILDVLGRMRLLLSGRDVDVPGAHVVAPLLGARLEELRRLASDLDSSAIRAYETAKEKLGDYPERGRQFLDELHYFLARSRDLQGRVVAAQVNPQQIGPVVDRLLKDARDADRGMRAARVFTSTWEDSGRTITILERMAGLVRS